MGGRAGHLAAGPGTSAVPRAVSLPAHEQRIQTRAKDRTRTKNKPELRMMSQEFRIAEEIRSWQKRQLFA